MTTPTANSVLMGGGGAPSAKLTEGVTLSGRIVAISDPYQEREYSPSDPGNGAPKFFKNGNPIMTFNLDLATTDRDASIEDDDGTRRLYMDGSRIKKAVRAAVQASGAPGLAVGGTLSITCTHYDTPGDVRSGKNYTATYAAGSAANTVLMGQQETPPQAPAVVAQPANPAPASQAAQAAPVAAQQAPGGPTPEQVAAVKAAGLNPADVFPGYTGG